jgi:hypothetical protein
MARFAWLLAVPLAACVTPRPGATLEGNVLMSPLADAVAFDHGCPAERIRFIRHGGGTTFDLDVCGTVRRYKVVYGVDKLTFFDATSLYPAASLPPPPP